MPIPHGTSETIQYNVITRLMDQHLTQSHGYLNASCFPEFLKALNSQYQYRFGEPAIYISDIDFIKALRYAFNQGYINGKASVK